MEYSCDTAGGTLRFANRAARAIVSRSAASPVRLADLIGEDADDLPNAAVVRVKGGLVRPVDPSTQLPPAVALNNRVLLGGMNIGALVGTHGTVAMLADGPAINL